MLAPVKGQGHSASHGPKGSDLSQVPSSPSWFCDELHPQHVVARHPAGGDKEPPLQESANQNDTHHGPEKMVDLEFAIQSH